MAYFANSSEGAALDNECQDCPFFKRNCPILRVQEVYNYDQCNNDVASQILYDLIKDDGTCSMKQEYRDYEPKN